MNTRNYRITNSAKILIIEMLIGLAGVFSGFTWNLYNKNKAWDNYIYPNVFVSGIYLGGKTIDEGRKLLKEQFVDPVLNNKIDINVDGKKFTLDKTKVISESNLDYIVEQAFNYGKNYNQIEKYKLLNDKKDSQEFSISFKYNEDYIKNTVKHISSEINRDPSNATIYYTDEGTLQISDDKNGIKIDETMLESDIKNEVTEIYNSDRNINAKIEEIPAGITDEMLSRLNTKIASFSTDYGYSSLGRAHNIELSTKSINGKIIMPGETFSFNETVGERTVERGYMEAPVIVGITIDSGLGGGICQVSSALYNAVLNTGINSVERVRHSIPSDYVPLGLDATVDWNNIDYIFKNTLDYPLYIQAFTENRILHINVYSDSSLTNKGYKIWNEVYETVQADIQIIDNPNMVEGETVVSQKGYQGYKVKVYRDTFENGNLINNEIVSDDFYPPVPKIINRGVRSIK